MLAVHIIIVHGYKIIINEDQFHHCTFSNVNFEQLFEYRVVPDTDLAGYPVQPYFKTLKETEPLGLYIPVSSNTKQAFLSGAEMLG